MERKTNYTKEINKYKDIEDAHTVHNSRRTDRKSERRADLNKLRIYGLLINKNKELAM